VRKLILSSLILIASAQAIDSVTVAPAVDSLASWFKEGTVKGNIKYYYIETKKDKPGPVHTSAHANSVGGQLSYTTADWDGFKVGATFMTTNGFALPTEVDTSILGKDNGVRHNSYDRAKDSFSVLGEAFVSYNYKDFSALFGRKVIKTPLIHAKEVRMLPSAVQGAFVDYKFDEKYTLGASYLTHFKQRTSDKFTNIIEHALGERTELITGHHDGDVIVVDGLYQGKMAKVRAYNYYAQDFMNSFYIDADFKNKLDSGWTMNAGYQYIYQKSIGNADDNLNRVGSLTGGDKIASNAFGFKFNAAYDESTLGVAITKVLSNSDRHDSLVLPWDGTPLFSNMITSNDLFQSLYGKALNADSIYIGGSLGIKLAYTQKYDFTGIKGFKTSLAYLNVDNNKFSNNQRDYNAVVSYGIGTFSVALKGIWVRHNSSANQRGTVSQIDKLTQYRVIANLKF
jgi:hypothetical protein